MPIPRPSRVHVSHFALALFSLSILSACDAPIEEAVYVEPSPIVAEPSIDASSGIAEESTTTRSASGVGRPRAGVVTAADIDDTLNFRAFLRYASVATRDTALPLLSLKNPVLVRLVGPDNTSAPGVRVTLRKPGAAVPFFDGYSGVDGRIAVIPGAFDTRLGGKVELSAFPAGQGKPTRVTLETGAMPHKITLPFNTGWRPDFLDLAFVVDTTGSMADELAWLTKELNSVVRIAKRAAPGVDIRFGLVVYRDRGDDYVVRNFGFTKSQAEMQRWLRAQDANGGGDYPEAAAAALASAADLNWRRGKGERLMFHIADAPPHTRDARAYLRAAGTAAQKGIQIFGLGASGVADEAEFLMRQAAIMTQGRYLFLTDDSGVGYAHAEPKVACYQVTSLKSLVARVLASELTGRRVEPRAGDVIRQVGSYRRGFCLQ